MLWEENDHLFPDDTALLIIDVVDLVENDKFDVSDQICSSVDCTWRVSSINW